MSALDELGRQLGDAVERRSQSSAAGGREPRRRSPSPGRRWLVVGTGVVLLAVAIAVTRLSSERTTDRAMAATLPALRHARSDVSRLTALPPNVRKTMDLRRAYEFSTASGTGYVLASANQKQICVVLAKPDAEFQSTCASSNAVHSRGLVSGLVRPKTHGVLTTVAVVLPDGAPAPTIRYGDGSIKRLVVLNGVATATLPPGGLLRVAAREKVRTLTVPRRMPGGPPRHG